MNFIPLNGWPQLKDIPEKLEHFREVYARFAKVNRWYRSIEETELTGNPVIFEKALKLNALEVGVDLLPIQSGSGDPSPTNVRPISGRTECVVDRCGFNIWDGTIILGKVIKCTDGTELVDSGYDCTDFIPVISNTPYYFNVYSTVQAQLRGMAWYDGDKNYISGIPAPANTKYGLITSPSNAKYVRCSLEKQYEDNACINISDPSKDGTYEPYITPVTITIALGTTVYGGTLDVKTGVLTIDRAIVSYSGSESESWILATNDRMYIPISGALSGGWDVQQASIANEFKYNTAIYNTDATGYYIAQANLYVRKSGTTTVEDFKTFLASNPLTLVYELATPQTVQLTGAELEMLKGYNLISTDADSLTVKAYTI